MKLTDHLKFKYITRKGVTISPTGALEANPRENYFDMFSHSISPSPTFYLKLKIIWTPEKMYNLITAYKTQWKYNPK